MLRQRAYQRNHARLKPMRDGSIAFYSTYEPGLVSSLKALIPAQDRKWDRDETAWRVAPAHAQTCADLAQKYLGVEVQVPVIASTTTSGMQLLKVEYIGAAKDRGDGQESAFGWWNEGWNVIFPLKALRGWFEPFEQDKPAATATLYGVLGVSAQAPPTMIKSAYRRAARTYHPDYNKESDAAEQFRRIQRAWEVLSDPGTRARYDAGLALTASLKHQQLPRGHKLAAHWKPPLRSGWVLCEGEEKLGRFVVSRIMQWADLTNDQGQIAVSYWPTGGKMFKTKWVDP